MKRLLMETVSLDTFVTLQNGNLILDFAEPSRERNPNPLYKE